MNKHEVLQRTARYLMLHSSFTSNIGLFEGKMGIILFFMNYSRYTKCKRYEKFAGELIDEIYAEIHIDCSPNFGNGLAGIGWGMEYLIRNHFVKADPDEVLKALDNQILERDVRRVKDFSMENGLKGIATYVISRCAGREYSCIFEDISLI
ncbi:lanthionine synthetase LanC family protein, partial [Bacteroides faecichinchillae]|uniref:lanthionine synthetase LanC family protein n=1 Tax=Bacteroides faecichinchillae TaxID=871325 RepID=UPI00053B9D14